MNLHLFRNHHLDILAALTIIVSAVLGFWQTTIPPEATAEPVSEQLSAAAAEPDIFPRAQIRAPILVYHHIDPSASGHPGTRPYKVTPAEFAAQMTILAEEGYVPVTISDVLDAFDGISELPALPIVITFDDGRENQHTYAFPVLQEHGFRAVTYPFSNAISREDYLTWEHLQEFLDAGWEVGSHTRYHPYLTKSSDAELTEELTISKNAFESKLGIEVRTIAWPFGLVDERVINAARAAGYDGGRGLEHGIIQMRNERMVLHAHIMPGGEHHLRNVIDQ